MASELLYADTRDGHCTRMAQSNECTPVSIHPQDYLEALQSSLQPVLHVLGFLGRDPHDATFPVTYRAERPQDGGWRALLEDGDRFIRKTKMSYSVLDEWPIDDDGGVAGIGS